MRKQQCVDILRHWELSITSKQNLLSKSSKIFSITNYLFKITNGGLLVALIALDTFLLSESLNNSDYIFIISLSVTIGILQVISAIITTADGVMNPEKKSRDCSRCSKDYHQLLSEIRIAISDILGSIDGNLEDAYENADENLTPREAENYSLLCQNIESKEQII